LSVRERMKVALDRALEATSEELLFAFAAANREDEIHGSKLPEYMHEYMRRVMGSYSLAGLRQGIGMACRASGIDAVPGLSTAIAVPFYMMAKVKSRRMAAVKKYGASVGAIFQH
jgi:hypothetical protein